MYLHSLRPPIIEFYCHSIAERIDPWKKFNFLKLIAVSFVTQDVSYPGKCSIALEKKIYSVTLKYQLSLFGVGMLMCAQSYKTVWEPRECSLSIFQARILKWVAISSSKACSQARVWTLVSCINKKIITWATWITMSCKTCVFPFIFLLDKIFIVVSDVLKFPLLLCYFQFPLL